MSAIAKKEHERTIREVESITKIIYSPRITQLKEMTKALYQEFGEVMTQKDKVYVPSLDSSRYFLTNMLRWRRLHKKSLIEMPNGGYVSPRTYVENAVRARKKEENQMAVLGDLITHLSYLEKKHDVKLTGKYFYGRKSTSRYETIGRMVVAQRKLPVRIPHVHHQTI
jgi:hypothetical protein